MYAKTIMGMFDYLKSSYNLGDTFTNKICQTKDIEDGIGGTMSFYWIDPNGLLWCGDYKNTHNFEIIDEDDPRYDPKLKFLNYEWVPTGNHGRYYNVPITKYVEIYPEKYNGDWEEWPRLLIHFKYGKVHDYEKTTNGSKNKTYHCY